MARAQPPPQIYTAVLPPVKVTPEMRAALGELARASNLTMSDVVREAVTYRLAIAAGRMRLQVIRAGNLPE